MKVDKELVQSVAQLAQLKISDHEMQLGINKMKRVLDLVDQMQSVDTTGVEPMSHPLDAVQILRPDKVTETDQRQLFQSNAPQTEDGLYLVPRVID